MNKLIDMPKIRSINILIIDSRTNYRYSDGVNNQYYNSKMIIVNKLYDNVEYIVFVF